MFSTNLAAAAGKMFSTGHIAFLLFFTLIPIGLAILLKYKTKSSKWVMIACMVICAISELSRIVMYIRETEDGFYLPENKIPLHMCSIQVIFIFIFGLSKNQNLKDKLIAFFIPTALIGGFLAEVIPTVYMTQGTVWSPKNIQYFVYHGMLIFLALYLYLTEYKKLSLKGYAFSMGFTGLLFVLSIFVNAALQDGGVNFFFTAAPPAKNLPLLNLDSGWLMYAFNLIWIGALLITLAYLPVIIREVNKRINKSGKADKAVAFVPEETDNSFPGNQPAETEEAFPVSDADARSVSVQAPDSDVKKRNSNR